MCLKIKTTYHLHIWPSVTALQQQSTDHHDVRTAATQDSWQSLTPHLLKAILIPDHTYIYIFRGIPSLNIAGYNVYEYLLLPAQTAPHYSITCPTRPISLHYMPQTAPYHSITCPNRPISLQSITNICYSSSAPASSASLSTDHSPQFLMLSNPLSLSRLPFFSHYAGWFRRKGQYFVMCCYHSLWRIKSYERVSVIRNGHRGRVARMLHLWAELSYIFLCGGFDLSSWITAYVIIFSE